jgi:Tfp pilus assembly protein PilX
MTMKLPSKQKGYLLYIAVLMIAVIGFLALNISNIMNESIYSNVNLLGSDKALYVAESGLFDVAHRLALPDVATRSSCVGIQNTNLTLTLITGNYTASTQGPYFANSTTTPTFLSTAMTAANPVSTVPVATAGALANFQPSGRIMIDYELINYTGLNTTTAPYGFTGATRAVDGSVAAAHATTAAISQYQCAVQSLSKATGNGNLSGFRLIKQAQALQYGWAVGNVVGTNFTLSPWNAASSELKWSNLSANSATTARSLMGISMLSYSDGWAVGTNKTFLHWNGNAWAAQVPAGIANTVTYQAVFCSASNNCHAVGIASGGNPDIADYNGTAWTDATMTNTTNTSLYGLSCVPNTPGNCWAVGYNTGTQRFYQWNGTRWTGITQTGLTTSTTPYNGVFCNSATDCWAVGPYNFARLTAGTAWTTITTRQRGNMPNIVYQSVYCNASDDCWAVGAVNGTANTFVHWDGQAWSLDSSVVTPAVTLFEVKCYNSSDCWAVGAVSNNQPVINHWNGTAWSNFAVSGLPNAALNSLSLVKSVSTQPWGPWAELNAP